MAEPLWRVLSGSFDLDTVPKADVQQCVGGKHVDWSTLPPEFTYDDVLRILETLGPKKAPCQVAIPDLRKVWELADRRQTGSLTCDEVCRPWACRRALAGLCLKGRGANGAVPRRLPSGHSGCDSGWGGGCGGWKCGWGWC